MNINSALKCKEKTAIFTFHFRNICNLQKGAQTTEQYVHLPLY